MRSSTLRSLARASDVNTWLRPSEIRPSGRLSTTYTQPVTQARQRTWSTWQASARDSTLRYRGWTCQSSSTTKTISSRSLHIHTRPGSKPGEEPGLHHGHDEPQQHHTAVESKPGDITVIDFSADHVEMSQYSSTEVQESLSKEHETRTSCRWICMDGIDRQSIAALAKAKKIHPLAVEDVLSHHERTKVDFFPNHLHAVLPLQKLVTMNQGFERTPPATAESTMTSTPPSIVTLQQRRSPGSRERTRYMERISPLSRRHLAVSVEQVSIFMMDDNTVISIFERSALDVLRPLAGRLHQEGTILRKSADASLLFQAICDTIVDLAIPITGAYNESIADLEYEVLTRPDIRLPHRLYALSSEINQLQLGMRPIAQLVGSLRDHPSHLAVSQGRNAGVIPPPPAHHSHAATSTATISPVAQMYFRDVEDHLILIVTSLDAMNLQTENLTTLIYNQLGTSQNESINRLTLTTIFFLPLSFLTGYFGMNFDTMWTVEDHSELFFWSIAVPVTFVTSWLLSRWIKKASLIKKAIMR